MQHARMISVLVMGFLFFGCQETKVEIHFESENSGTLRFISKYKEEELNEYGLLTSTTTEYLPIFQEDSESLIPYVYSGLQVVHTKEYVLQGGLDAKEYLISFNSIESLNTLLYDVGIELIHEQSRNRNTYRVKRKVPEKIIQVASGSGQQSFEQPYAENNSFLLEMILLLYAKSSVVFELSSAQKPVYVSSGELGDSVARLQTSLGNVVAEKFSWTVRMQ